MSNRPVNILMLGGAKRVSMGRMLVDAGRRMGREVNLVSYELEEHVPISLIATIVIGQRWGDSDIMDHLHQTVLEHDINVMIPFVDGAVAIAAAYRDTYGGIWAPVGDRHVSELMFDKIQADQEFRAVGIPVPQSYVKGRPAFPLIAKPRFGSASKGIQVITGPRQFKNIVSGDDMYIIQEYIANRREYTVDCFVSDDGRIICAVPRIRLEVIGGEVSRTMTVRDSRLEKLSATVLERLGLRGAVTLQFIEDLNDGRLLLMEINPRLGGGAVCAVHAGADIPAYIIRSAIGERVSTCTSWEDGTEIVRYQQEVAFHK
ncbi:MAG: ATP-grasp domain-containing protein [Pseudoflavonifractor sp.]|nr:ATP-grasp domain-containing protein [Pseudoflavonifractor sp.]